MVLALHGMQHHNPPASNTTINQTWQIQTMVTIDNCWWMMRSPQTDRQRECKQYFGEGNNDFKVSFCKYLVKKWIQKCQESAWVDQKHDNRPPDGPCFQDIDLTETELTACADFLFGFALLTSKTGTTVHFDQVAQVQQQHWSALSSWTAR